MAPVCAPECTARIKARGFHVRELYRVIRLAEDALREGDSTTALALLEMTGDQPPAEPHDLSPEEFAQAFEASP